MNHDYAMDGGRQLSLLHEIITSDEETLTEEDFKPLSNKDMEDWNDERHDRYQLSLTEYQELTFHSAVYPGAGEVDSVAALSYCGLGLGGETGEVLDHLKKIQRDSDGEVSSERREAISGELGDVLWYLARTAAELGLDLNTVAKDNLDKLFDRKARGVIQGSGDKR